jgi:hypothetical protein
MKSRLLAIGRWILPWFPTVEQLRSSNFYVFPQTVRYYGVHIDAATLIFVRPSDRMIFYFSESS